MNHILHLTSPSDALNWATERHREGSSIALVPTMGALHKGHISLVEKSIDENEITIVSIFINPTQFNDKNDLKTYPQKVENDINMLSSLNVTYLLLPSEDEMYKNGYNYKITEKNLSFKMEGLEREGHFDGVLTVVMKLFVFFIYSSF